MTADWTVLELIGIRDIAVRAAHSVASEYRGITDVEDLYQDALILCASNAELIRGHYDSDNRGLVFTWLRHRLVDAVRPEAYRRNRTITLDRVTEAA
ncbi:hypothetical protein [Actinoplanes sp. NPDC049118]|uniref:hypothetical protein n=1 Tax=Actinoplanes sp. NPDC049118 TaxID=3155769 RepID=UPI0033EA15AB